MNNIKAVVFDFGGVLGSDANTWTEDNEVFERTGLVKKDIEDLFWLHWDELKSGKVDLSILFEDIVKISKKPVTVSELREMYHSKILINPVVLDVAKKLKDKYELYILANESFEGMNTKIEKFNLGQYFQKIFNSAELGLSKPDPMLYKTVLESINLNPESIVFIDDQEKNVNAANELGITSFLYTNTDKLLTDLEPLL